MNTIKPSELNPGDIAIIDGTRRVVTRKEAAGSFLRVYFVDGSCEQYRRHIGGVAEPVTYDREVVVADGPECDRERDSVLIAYGLDPSDTVDCPAKCTDGRREVLAVTSTGPGRADCMQDTDVTICPRCEGVGEVTLADVAARQGVWATIDLYGDLGQGRAA